MIQFRRPPKTSVSVDMHPARGVAERLSMPWCVVREFRTVCSNHTEVFVTLEGREDEIIHGVIEHSLPIISTCPLVVYSCQILIEENDGQDAKVTVCSQLVPEQFQRCNCGFKNQNFELCSCLVLKLFEEAFDPKMHNEDDIQVAMAVFRTLGHALDRITKHDETGINFVHPYRNWTKNAFLFPYHMLYNLPLMVQGSNSASSSALLESYFDFSLFCQTYQHLGIYFSLCRYMHPTRARLFFKNPKVAHTLLKKIQQNPFHAFLGQLIEVEGLRQAAAEAESGDIKKLYVLRDQELHAAAHLHEELLCEALLRGDSNVVLYCDSVEQKILTWMGGIVVQPGSPIGRLAIASLAEVDCLERLQSIASHWRPQKLVPGQDIQHQLSTTGMLFVNTRSTCGRSSPFIKPHLDLCRQHSFVTFAPADVTALEDRFDEMCRSMESFYNSRAQPVVIPVVTIVDLHLFSPLMLRTVLTFLLECQHGFKYNDIHSPKSYIHTKTGLPFKFLFLGDFNCVSFRQGLRVVDTFLNANNGANRACYFRDQLGDVYEQDDNYAIHCQLGLELEAGELTEVEDQDGLYRIYVESKKTRLYRSDDPLPTEPKDENEFIAPHLAPTLIELPFSCVHLATVSAQEIYTALSMTAGKVILHISKDALPMLALK